MRWLSAGLRALAQRGFAVYPAQDARQALRTWRVYEGRFDAVVADVQLPDQRGSELVRTLTDQAPRLVALLITGHKDAAAVVPGDASTDVPVLRKPFTPGLLAAKVRELLDQVS